ncbi:hypothetical protein RISK_004405 [Rhodopirellula islandica]|uniref:Uncharacterized protein n=1 Tax=Rhodopirellula islandica TaxID=595434 RepID=A0A0J1BAG0_RHOIS|nr:hypothetical protein RISK_004405 [Rhodopirellula islandica]
MASISGRWLPVETIAAVGKDPGRTRGDFTPSCHVGNRGPKNQAPDFGLATTPIP